MAERRAEFAAAGAPGFTPDTFTCDQCGAKKSGEDAVRGEEITLCQDCNEKNGR